MCLFTKDIYIVFMYLNLLLNKTVVILNTKYYYSFIYFLKIKLNCCVELHDNLFCFNKTSIFFPRGETNKKKMYL